MRNSGNELIDIPTASEEKDLGILFEKSLKFNKHILNVANRCKKLTRLIRRTFRYMNKTLFLQLYKSLIRSIVDYGIVVWYPTSPAPIAQLVECPLRGTGGHGFDPGPRHTKVVKNGTSCSSLGTQT